MSLAQHYNKRANIRRVTLTASSFSAAGTEAWEDIEQDFKCAIQPLSARELDLYGKTTAQVTHRAFLPTGLDIRARDRLVEGNPIEALLGLGGTEYEIEGVIDAAGMGRHQEVLLLEQVAEEVDGG